MERTKSPSNHPAGDQSSTVPPLLLLGGPGSRRGWLARAAESQKAKGRCGGVICLDGYGYMYVWMYEGISQNLPCLLASNKSMYYFCLILRKGGEGGGEGGQYY